MTLDWRKKQMSKFTNAMLANNSNHAVFVGVRSSKFFYGSIFSKNITDAPKTIKVAVQYTTKEACNPQTNMEFRTITTSAMGDSQIESNVKFSPQVEKAIDSVFKELENWRRRNMFE